MDFTLPLTFCILLEPFRPLFTAPSFQNFLTLATGWLLCIGRHSISRVLQFSGAATGDKHFSAYYRFFSRAVWEPDELGRTLVPLILRWIPAGWLYALVDDTLCRKSGPHIWGGGMHYDPLLSTYGRGRKRRVVLSFGHNWVILSLWVPLPWNPTRGIALPVLWRLYRSAKQCEPGQYRKRTELATELVQQLTGWLPPERRLVVVGDSEYSCRTMVKGKPFGVTLIGTMSMNAACFALPPPYCGRGRRRQKGERLPAPQQLAAAVQVPWQRKRLAIYGRQVEILVKTQVCLWYHVAGSQPIRLLVTRDPKGRIEDRAYFCTDPEWEIDAIVQGVARRWPAEVMHHDVKQELGVADPQNGFWRRLRGQPRPPKQAGPDPHAERGQQAVLHTAPLAFLVYTLVVVWYFQYGTVAADVQRVRQHSPWYRHKQDPSFADMLHAARRAIWVQRIFAEPSLRPVSAKIIELFPEWLVAA